MSGEIRKADPDYRRKVRIAAAVGLVLLAALYAVVREVLPSVERWIAAVPGQEAARARPSAGSSAGRGSAPARREEEVS